MHYLTHYQTTNFRLFQLKEFADDNFKFDENEKNLSRQVENTVGKGETAHYEQFLLFPQCFQKVCFPEASKGVILWEWVNLFAMLSILMSQKLSIVEESIEVSLPHKPIYMTLKKQSFQNLVKKGENADSQYFLLFPQYFLPYDDGQMSVNLGQLQYQISVEIAFNLDCTKFFFVYLVKSSKASRPINIFFFSCVFY